mgnify:FL=1
MSTPGSSRGESNSDVARYGSRERGEGNDSDNHRRGNQWWDDNTWGPEVVGRDETDQEEFLAMNELETALVEAGYASSLPLPTQSHESEEEIVLIDEDGTGESDDYGLPGNFSGIYGSLIDNANMSGHILQVSYMLLVSSQIHNFISIQSHLFYKEFLPQERINLLNLLPLTHT